MTRIGGLLLLTACAAPSPAVTGAIADVMRAHEDVIVRLETLSQDARAFAQARPDLHRPGTAVADLDGDRQDDVALLTVDKSGQDAYLKVFLCTLECRLVTNELVGTASDVLLQLVAPSAEVETSQSLPNGGTLRLAHFGVRVINFGKSEVVFFWDSKSKSMQSLTTGD